MHGREAPTLRPDSCIGMKRRVPLQKYGAPLYGVAWPEGPHAYMAGGGNLGIENKCVWRNGAIAWRECIAHFPIEMPEPCPPIACSGWLL